MNPTIRRQPGVARRRRSAGPARNAREPVDQEHAHRRVNSEIRTMSSRPMRSGRTKSQITSPQVIAK
jgi:hypothetical protein